MSALQVRALACLEAAAVAIAYIAISITAVTTLDLSFIFPATWTPEERGVGSSFAIGALVQIVLVLAGAYALRLPDLRLALANTFAPSNQKAWMIAVLATVIHIATAVLVFIPQPERVWEPSSVNLVLSIVPAADGWSQEVLFRGYVLYRLARGGLPALPQILISGVLFAAIHIGYVGEGAWGVLAPIIGTFMLGSFYAWSVQTGRGSLMPVVLCHMAVVIVAQPWLALAR